MDAINPQLIQFLSAGGLEVVLMMIIWLLWIEYKSLRREYTEYLRKANEGNLLVSNKSLVVDLKTIEPVAKNSN